MNFSVSVSPEDFDIFTHAGIHMRMFKLPGLTSDRIRVTVPEGIALGSDISVSYCDDEGNWHEIDHELAKHFGKRDRLTRMVWSPGEYTLYMEIDASPSEIGEGFPDDAIPMKLAHKVELFGDGGFYSKPTGARLHYEFPTNWKSKKKGLKIVSE